ncbi:MAG: metalloregulator ArsR/SmtB family transcription factor [Anaerolineaceae bacterium]
MTEKTLHPIDIATAQSMALTFKGLGDTTRVQVLSILMEGECSVNDLACAIGISQSALSHQLQLLRNLGFVSSRRDGQKIFYNIDDEHVGDLFKRAFEHSKHLNTKEGQ